MPDLTRLAAAFAPQLVLLLGLLGALVVALLVKKEYQTVWVRLLGGVIVLAYAKCISSWSEPTDPILGMQLPLDYPQWAGLMAFGFALAWVFECLTASKSATPKGIYLASWLAIWLGGEIVVASTDYLMMYIGLVTMSLSTYFLIATQNSSPKYASEAALKYFILGGLAMGILLYGLSFFYGLTGSLDLHYEAWMTLPQLKQQLFDNPLPFYAILMILLGMSFKMGTWPMHHWVMDVYRTAHIPVLIALLILPKIAVLVAAQHMYPAWSVLTPFARHLIAGMIIISMTYANLMALTRTSWLELLSWSSVSQNSMAWILVLVLPQASAQVWILWFVFYAVGTAGLLAMTSQMPLAVSKNLGQLSPWLKAHPLKGIAMVVLLLSLAGLPPLAGFFPKLLLLSSLDTLIVMLGYEPGVYLFLALLVNIVIGFAYYLKPIYLGYIKSAPDSEAHTTNQEPDNQSFAPSKAVWLYVYGCAIALGIGGLLIGLWP